MKFAKSNWLFKSPGSVPNALVPSFSTSFSRWPVRQPNYQSCSRISSTTFSYGRSSSWSSDAGLAQTDLRSYMEEAAENAAKFVAAFVDGCGALTREGLAALDTDFVNDLLAEHKSEYFVQGDTIVPASTEPKLASAKAVADASSK